MAGPRGHLVGALVRAGLCASGFALSGMTACGGREIDFGPSSGAGLDGEVGDHAATEDAGAGDDSGGPRDEGGATGPGTGVVTIADAAAWPDAGAGCLLHLAGTVGLCEWKLSAPAGFACPQGSWYIFGSCPSTDLRDGPPLYGCCVGFDAPGASVPITARCYYSDVGGAAEKARCTGEHEAWATRSP